jgi:lipoxygenase
MLMKPQLTQQHYSHYYSTRTPILLLKPPIYAGNASAVLVPISRHKRNKSVRARFIPSSIKAVATATDDDQKPTSVKAIVTVKLSVAGLLSNLGISRGLDDVKDLLGKTLLLELVSTHLDPSK